MHFTPKLTSEEHMHERKFFKFSLLVNQYILSSKILKELISGCWEYK